MTSIMDNRMISVTVHYGNYNRFTINCPPSIKLGSLPAVFSRIINKSVNDVLYLIMGGIIIGNKPYDLNTCLKDCRILNTCVISMVMRDPSVTYSDMDLYINSWYCLWAQQHIPEGPVASQPESNPSIPGQAALASLMQVIGLGLGLELGIPMTNPNAPSNPPSNPWADVAVTIPVDEYEQHITQAEPLAEACAICSHVLDEDVVSLACNHCFHNSCIHTWLTGNAVTCPVCNYDVREPVV